MKVKRIKATEDTAAIEKWIRLEPETPKKLLVHGLVFTVNKSYLSQLSATRDIGDVHRSKPPPTVHYQKAMPDIDDLMQVVFLNRKLKSPLSSNNYNTVVHAKFAISVERLREGLQ